MGSGILRVCSRGKGLNNGAEFCVYRAANDIVLVKFEGLVLAGKCDSRIKRSA